MHARDTLRKCLHSHLVLWLVPVSFDVTIVHSVCAVLRPAALATCRNALQVYVNKCPTRCNYTQSILSVNCSTCFEWSLHPSTGPQISVSTAVGTSQLYLLPVAIMEELRLSLNSSMIATTADVYISRYSDSLRDGRSGDRIPVGNEIFRPASHGPRGPSKLLYNGRCVIPSVKGAEAWR